MMNALCSRMIQWNIVVSHSFLHHYYFSQQFWCRIATCKVEKWIVRKKGENSNRFLISFVAAASTIVVDWCFVITLCCDLFNILAPRKKREWVVRYEIEHERKIVVKRVSFRDSRNYFYTEIRRFFLSAQLQWLFQTKENVLRKFLINKSLNYFCCRSTKCY